jgi:hypothetical protein
LTRSTQAERITALEIQLATLQSSMTKHMIDTEKRHESMNDKLDDLLGLRNRGVGAFWLASALAGTGIIGAVLSFFDWWKGM